MNNTTASVGNIDSQELISSLVSSQFRDYFKVKLQVQNGQYVLDQVDGYQEPQQVLTQLQFKMSALRQDDLETSEYDNCIFSLKLEPATAAASPPFVPYDQLDISKILYWPGVMDQVKNQTRAWQSVIVDRWLKEQALLQPPAELTLNISAS